MKAELVKIRIEGHPENVNALSALIRAVANVADESKDYPNRPPSEGVRRYLTVIIESEGEQA